MASVRPLYLSASLAHVPLSRSDDTLEIGSIQLLAAKGIALGAQSVPAAAKIIGLDVAEAGSASGEALCHSQTNQAAVAGGMSVSGGALAMNSQKVTGLPPATAGSASGDALCHSQTSDITLACALAMGNNKITGLGTPTGDGDAATKAYIDQKVVQGGSVREAILASDQLDSVGMLPAVAMYFVGQPVSGDNVVLNDGATTRTYQFGTGGDVTVTIGADAAGSMSNLASAIDGDGSAVCSATFDTNLDAINATGAVVIIGNGVASTERVYGVWGTQANCQIVDFSSDYDYTSKSGEALPSSDPTSTNFGPKRATADLMDGEIHYDLSGDVQYSWDDSSNVWQTLSGTGAIPVATGASGGGVQGKATFDTDYGLSVAGGVVSLNTDANGGLMYNSGALKLKEDVTGGANLASVVNLSGNGVAVKVDDSSIEEGASSRLAVKALGITNAMLAGSIADSKLLQITTGDKVAGSAVELAASNPGIENSSGLRLTSAIWGDGLAGGGGSAVNVDLASNPGLEFSSNQLRVKVASANELELGASGLSVNGVPTEFNIGSVAVGTDVTSVNLDTNCDGSQADSLHKHGKLVDSETWQGNASIAVNKVLYIAAAGKLGIGDIDTEAAARIIGVCAVTCTGDGNSIGVQQAGYLASAGSGWTVNGPVFADTDGSLTQTAPGSGKWATRVGFAASATALHIDIKEIGQVP